MDQQNGFHGGPSGRRKGYRLAAWSLLASVIDGLILISLSCIFVLAFTFVIKGSHLESSLLRLFAEVFFLCSWIYMVTLRVLLGSSVGEWACDLRLGQPHERLAKTYPLRIILRANLILLTGLVILPLFSLLLGRDIPGQMSGVQLLSLK